MTKKISNDNIKDLILTLRNKQVILDKDLAKLYEVKTKQINRVVKRNKERFPEDFMFQLNEDEVKNLRFHFGTSSWGGRRYLPYVFTEEGVAMLSGLLKSKIAVNTSINIMKAFVAMRHFLMQNANIFNKFQQIDQKFIEHDKDINRLFNAIEDKSKLPEKGIFFDGQVYDAYNFITNLIKQAKESIILIDNYINTSTITLFSEKNKNVNVTIYTKEISEKLKLAEEKFNKQYNNLEIKPFNKSHDRFLIIDNTTYHIGASLKDLGKKWTAFSKFDRKAIEMLDKID